MINFPDKISPSELYHENSKNVNPVLPKNSVGKDVQRLLSLSKRYLSAIKLPLPISKIKSERSFEQVIKSRRSAQDGFSGEPISIEALSYLLQYSYGVTGEQILEYDGKKYAFPLRAAPSEGALYYVEIYPIVFSVEGVEAGIYHFEAEKFELALLKKGDFRPFMNASFYQPERIENAAVIFLLTGLFSLKRQDYGERSYRLLVLDAGHIGENIYLSATAKNLAVVGTTGFLDDKINELLEIDGANEAMIYSLIIGEKSSRLKKEEKIQTSAKSILSQVPVRNNKTTYQDLGEGIVLARPDLGSSSISNETGLAVWRLIDGKRNLKMITEALLEEYDIPEEELSKQIVAFIRILTEKKFITLD